MNIGHTLKEVFYDAGYIFYLAGKGLNHIAVTLGLQGALRRIVLKIANIAEHILNFAADRLKIGLNSAYQDEPTLSITKMPYPWHDIEEITQEYCIDFTAQERPFKNIAAHYMLSVPNLILNNALAFVSIPAAIILDTAFITKVGIKAITNIPISVPTYAANVSVVALGSARIVFIDAINDVAGIAVCTFKVSEALYLNKAVTGLGKLLVYIPTAIFS